MTIMWKTVSLVLLATLACLLRPAFSGERFDPPLPFPTFGGASSPCPWLPKTIRLKKDRDARTAELRRRILRKPLVDRYLAAAPAAPRPAEAVEKLPDEATDFLGDINSKLSSDTLALCREILANPEAEPLARLIALRMLWKKDDNDDDAAAEKERFERERLAWGFRRRRCTWSRRTGMPASRRGFSRRALPSIPGTAEATRRS